MKIRCNGFCRPGEPDDDCQMHSPDHIEWRKLVSRARRTTPPVAQLGPLGLSVIPGVNVPGGELPQSGKSNRPRLRLIQGGLTS